eukprot:4900631-Prorocentrum_lima.AAC.1
MITNQRGSIRVGEAAVAIQPNKDVHLGGTKVPQKVQKLLVLTRLQSFSGGMGRDDPDDAKGQSQ